VTSPSLQVVPIPNGSFAENCYLVYDPGRPETILVDPGEEAERFLAEAARRNRRISAIWLTHAHIDHIQGVAEVQAATGAPIHLHPGDRDLYDALPQQGLWLGLRLAKPPPPDHSLAHGQQLRIGAAAFEVRHVPGHSPGHVCFVGDGVVLGGDVLFDGSIGRSDLPGGDYDTLIASIQRELLSLPDATIVYPGHGGTTTIGRERTTNPFLTRQHP
jgi:glyoxylase-like metal-dependent hydrolase (beta-lactamase superfamily II)